MALFENRYKAAAKAELERKAREIEEKRKAIEEAKSKETLDNQISDFSVLLAFSMSTELISAEQAESYERRVKQEAYELALAQNEMDMATKKEVASRDTGSFTMAEASRSIEKSRQEREQSARAAEQRRNSNRSHEEEPERTK